MTGRMTDGRPSIYSEEIVDAICERLADGRSLRSICLDDDMPGQTTVFRWLAEEGKESFRQKYARARETQADAIFDECLDIADNAANDWMERQGENSEGWELNGEHVQRTRLRLDTRKWMAGKLAPKKYGDKLDLTTDGKSLNWMAEAQAARERASKADA